jgi:hypothetical protein
MTVPTHQMSMYMTENMRYQIKTMFSCLDETNHVEKHKFDYCKPITIKEPLSTLTPHNGKFRTTTILSDTHIAPYKLYVGLYYKNTKDGRDDDAWIPIPMIGEGYVRLYCYINGRKNCVLHANLMVSTHRKFEAWVNKKSNLESIIDVKL